MNQVTCSHEWLVVDPCPECGTDALTEYMADAERRSALASDPQMLMEDAALHAQQVEAGDAA